MENTFLENPVTTEIIRNALGSAAKEMNASLFRSAYSPIIFEMKDCSVGIFNENAQILGQSAGLPIFLGNLEVTIDITVDYFGGKENMNEGDVYVLNDAYLTGTHLNDMTVLSPIFYKGELVGFTANRAHWLDLGSKDPGTPMDSTEIYQEGVRVGPTKIMDRGVLRQDVVDLICKNSRFYVNAVGDLNAQIAACKTGERRYIEIIERFGLDTVRRSIKDIFKQSEIVEREVISQIPEGTYYAEGALDNDGTTSNPVEVKVKVIVKDGKMIVDLTGSSNQAKGSTNCGLAQTISACRVAYKAFVHPEAPVTGGSFKPLEVITRPASIFTAEEPAGTSWYFSSLGLLIDLIIKALQDVIPDKAAAAHYGDSMVIYLAGLNPETGAPFLNVEATVGGWGASARADGQDCLINTVNGDFKNLPAEVFEKNYPLTINEYKIRADSGGPGKNRGGMGVIRSYHIDVDNVVLYLWFERSKTTAWGIQGGKEGKPPTVVVEKNGNKKEFLKVNAHPLEKDSQVVVLTGGGGGFGDPFERDVNKVLNDCVQGYITIEHARQEYGVAITDDYVIDEEITSSLRK